MTNSNELMERTYPELDEEIRISEIDLGFMREKIPKTRKFSVPEPKFST